MTMITPSYLGETIEYSSLHACRSTLEDPTILNTRYNDNRTTIITTNFEDQPAAGANGSLSSARAATRSETLGDRIGERMRSRLHEMCRVIKMEGEDFRQKFRSASFR